MSDRCTWTPRYAIFGNDLAGYHAENEYGAIAVGPFRTMALAQRYLDHHIAAILAICACGPCTCRRAGDNQS